MAISGITSEFRHFQISSIHDLSNAVKAVACKRIVLDEKGVTELINYYQFYNMFLGWKIGILYVHVVNECCYK